jgi:hypothetical protein
MRRDDHPEPDGGCTLLAIAILTVLILSVVGCVVKVLTHWPLL